MQRSPVFKWWKQTLQVKQLRWNTAAPARITSSEGEMASAQPPQWTANRLKVQTHRHGDYVTLLFVSDDLTPPQESKSVGLTWWNVAVTQSLTSPPPFSQAPTPRHILLPCRVCILAPGNQEQWAQPQRRLPWLQQPCPRPRSWGLRRKALGRPWLQAEEGNQISWWERLSRWTQELSVELSLSLLNQSWTKAEPAHKQQDHCLLAGTTAFWVCHAGWCVIILELPFVSRPDWVTGAVGSEAWESDSADPFPRLNTADKQPQTSAFLILTTET